jgi:hypothetical protein
VPEPPDAASLPDPADAALPEPPDDRYAILAAVPLRHLRSGLEVCADRGRVALPAAGRSDLEAALPGDAVYLYAYQVGDRPVPAATWRGELVRVVEAQDGEHPEPDLTPPTWREERVAGHIATDPEPTDDDHDDQAANDPADDDDLVGAGPTEVFLEVRALRELDRREWLFTNELVRKQDRGARTFVPLAPVRVRLPD